MKNPLISIVLATYNGEKYIKEQLESILQQSYDNIELIVVDDNSADDTVSIIKSYQPKFSNIKIYRNDVNIGFIDNFSKGMRLAKAEMVALSDQDDIWDKDKIQILYNALRDYDIVYSDSELIDKDGNTLGLKMSDIRNLKNYDNCLMYAIGAWSPGHSMLIRKSLIEKCYPFPSQLTHDYWLGYVASCHNAVGYVNRPLVKYRIHEKNKIGVPGINIKVKSDFKDSESEKELIRKRIDLLYEKCPDSLPQKGIYGKMREFYSDFSLEKNWKRMILFFRYRDTILAYKKKSWIMKNLFCIKMFFKIY